MYLYYMNEIKVYMILVNRNVMIHTRIYIKVNEQC